MKIRWPWRRRWTIAIVGRISGRSTSLEAMYRFSDARTALGKAAELNRNAAGTDLVLYEVQKR